MFAVIQLVARPLKVLVSTVGSSLTWPERAMLAWIAPRGIVAAAVSALFAIRLADAGYAEAPLLVPLTFMVIIGTVVLQSSTARALANALGVAEPDPKGVLLIGANVVSRNIAKALRDKGFRILLTDVSWENIRAARMEGLSTYYGSPVSEHADRHLDLVGIGRLLALSPHGELNALASMRYRSEFGKHRVYSVLTASEKSLSDKHKVGAQHRGNSLFGDDVTYAKLASLISQGGEIRSTQLTESFAFDDFRRVNRGAIPLFCLDKRGRLRLFLVGEKLAPERGWTLMSLAPPKGHAAKAPNAESKPAESKPSKPNPSAPKPAAG